MEKSDYIRAVLNGDHKTAMRLLVELSKTDVNIPDYHTAYKNFIDYFIDSADKIIKDNCKALKNQLQESFIDILNTEISVIKNKTIYEIVFEKDGSKKILTYSTFPEYETVKGELMKDYEKKTEIIDEVELNKLLHRCCLATGKKEILTETFKTECMKYISEKGFNNLKYELKEMRNKQPSELDSFFLNLDINDKEDIVEKVETNENVVDSIVIDKIELIEKSDYTGIREADDKAEIINNKEDSLKKIVNINKLKNLTEYGITEKEIFDAKIGYIDSSSIKDATKIRYLKNKDYTELAKLSNSYVIPYQDSIALIKENGETVLIEGTAIYEFFPSEPADSIVITGNRIDAFMFSKRNIAVVSTDNSIINSAYINEKSKEYKNVVFINVSEPIVKKISYGLNSKNIKMLYKDSIELKKLIREIEPEETMKNQKIQDSIDKKKSEIGNEAFYSLGERAYENLEIFKKEAFGNLTINTIEEFIKKDEKLEIHNVTDLVKLEELAERKQIKRISTTEEKRLILDFDNIEEINELGNKYEIFDGDRAKTYKVEYNKLGNICLVSKKDFLNIPEEHLKGKLIEFKNRETLLNKDILWKIRNSVFTIIDNKKEVTIQEGVKYGEVLKYINNLNHVCKSGRNIFEKEYQRYSKLFIENRKEEFNNKKVIEILKGSKVDDKTYSFQCIYRKYTDVYSKFKEKVAQYYKIEDNFLEEKYIQKRDAISASIVNEIKEMLNVKEFNQITPLEIETMIHTFGYNSNKYIEEFEKDMEADLKSKKISEMKYNTLVQDEKTNLAWFSNKIVEVFFDEIVEKCEIDMNDEVLVEKMLTLNHSVKYLYEKYCWQHPEAESLDKLFFKTMTYDEVVTDVYKVYETGFFQMRKENIAEIIEMRFGLKELDRKVTKSDVDRIIRLKGIFGIEKTNEEVYLEKLIKKVDTVTKTYKYDSELKSLIEKLEDINIKLDTSFLNDINFAMKVISEDTIMVKTFYECYKQVFTEKSKERLKYGETIKIELSNNRDSRIKLEAKLTEKKNISINTVKNNEGIKVDGLNIGTGVAFYYKIDGKFIGATIDKLDPMHQDKDLSNITKIAAKDEYKIGFKYTICETTIFERVYVEDIKKAITHLNGISTERHTIEEVNYTDEMGEIA